MELNESRRKERQMSGKEAVAFLRQAPYVFLATVNADDTPYCIPVSIYMNSDETVYIHCGACGKKIDNFKRNPAVCISCAEYGGTLPTENGGYIVAYRSVVAFGKIREVTDFSEKKDVLSGFCDQQIDPGIEAHNHFMKCVERSFAKTPIYKIQLTSISGKRNGSSEHIVS